MHLPSWLNGDLADFTISISQPDWRERFNDPAIWEQVHEIPDEELLEVHRRRKRRLIAFVRDRQTASALRAQGGRVGSAARRRKCSIRMRFTIGFARRFATYKRATLLFRDVERLKKILCNQERPVQIIIAGKAHPKDQPGKELHPRNRAALARRRPVEAHRLRRRLRHEGGARDWCRASTSG